ncbi:hypothetical protein BDY19DRAFT_989230 [Irpex rosettiformis]|uniref:Uncharacterized protein n=1 Tax=Irpex rosettiformis TaxID=378272 RepID=A0ACB8UH56_9APHY|nr:hypothetical protein BDY19DRAFT_989230 [Irpex rosettiformis]
MPGMVHRHISIAESYSVLGLSEGATLEVVRSTYKQLALKTHPDKNPGDENATVQFQRIGEAYNALLKYLDKSAPPPRPQPRAYNPFTGPEYDSEEEHDTYDYSDYYDEYDSEEEYYEQERMDFYMFLFEEMMRGRGGRFSQARFHHECDCPVHRKQREEEVKETEEQYQSRVRRAREEQENAEERRKQEAAHRKARQEEERAKERCAAEQRQKQKASKKKAQAATSRKAAEDKVRTQRQRSQQLRSAVFAAARSGNTAAVKEGIWQDSVDAAGGETQKGFEELLDSPPKDASETLSHIVASHGDSVLFEWLDAHGAVQEERDSRGYTTFHVALSGGHISILKYIMENHLPEDAESLYERPLSGSNLQLAIDSRTPEVVWMVLENKLCNEEEIADAWTHLTSSAGRQSSRLRRVEDKQKEIIDMLASYGKFNADSSPQDETDEHAPSSPSSQSTTSSSGAETPEQVPSQAKVRPKRGRGRGKAYRQPQMPSSSPVAEPSPSGSLPSNSRGPRSRGGGCGRGGFRGRDRGGAPPLKS